MTMQIPQLNMAEGMVLPGQETKAKNIQLDIDCDLKLENVVPNIEDGPHPNNVSQATSVIMTVGVQDQQDGDIDFSFDDSDKAAGKEIFGFTRDVRLFTFNKDTGGGGTYFQIEEGKLYNADQQVIRTTSKKDQVDLIERVFRISNNTGRYCNSSGLPTDWSVRNNVEFLPGEENNITEGERILGLTNPIEVCVSTPGGCYIAGNMERTCMDTTNNTFYIRSRIQDLHGRRWITDTSEDPYVNFEMR
jgi:hypothetical protein